MDNPTFLVFSLGFFLFVVVWVATDENRAHRRKMERENHEMRLEERRAELKRMKSSKE